MKNNIIFTFCIIINFALFAQTTSIPDENFEQALINQEIDSDGEINGHVLTTDIENVSALDLNGENIEDLTGIEGFSALEILELSNNDLTQVDLTANNELINLSINNNYSLSLLNLSGNPSLEILNCIYNYNLTNLDLHENTALKELVLGDASEVTNSNAIETLDLSKNVQLEKLWLHEMPYLTSVNLKNGHNDLLTDVYISCGIEETFCGPYCIEVDDFEAANQNEAPYDIWSTSQTSFSEDCSLGVKSIQKGDIVLFPNPVVEKLQVKTEASILQKIEIFNLQGKKLKTISKDFKTIDMADFPCGIYFLKINSEKASVTKKVVKI